MMNASPEGLTDAFGRTIRYLRLSVTDRCNFRCHYCRPPHGLDLAEPEELLTIEELIRLGRIFTQLGIGKIRITGGEPLLRRNLVKLVQALHAMPGLVDLSLSTNASGLVELARPLKQAGVQRLNISLDSLQPSTFAEITRGGDVHEVLAGIDAAIDAGFHPVKVNMVVMGSINDTEIPDMVSYARRKGLILRFIETMPVGPSGESAMGSFVPMEGILGRIRERFPGEMLPTGQPSAGAGPARYFRVAGIGADVGIISALSQHFCETCNRVRLSSRGALVLCLGQSDRVELRGLLRSGMGDEAIKRVIKEAVERKPKRHGFDQQRPEKVEHRMVALGG